ncbi:MAG: electron transport complex subunit RsxE [Pseudomonadota bacterium]
MSPSVGNLALDGLVRNNPATIQLLGLCPLLAVSTTFATSLALGLTTLVVLTVSSALVSLLRSWIVPVIRLPAQILIIASAVTCADLILQAWAFELHSRIGLFIALIVTNCTILARAEAFARRHGVVTATVDGIAMGSGFLVAILVLGSVREVLGHGTLGANLHLLWPGLTETGLQVADGGLLIILLPPGAFLVFGCLLALSNTLNARWIPSFDATDEDVGTDPYSNTDRPDMIGSDR